jgi:hypothetical protein
MERDRPPRPYLRSLVSCPHLNAGVAGAVHVTIVLKLVLLFTSLLAIPLAR